MILETLRKLPDRYDDVKKEGETNIDDGTYVTVQVPPILVKMNYVDKDSDKTNDDIVDE